MTASCSCCWSHIVGVRVYPVRVMLILTVVILCMCPTGGRAQDVPLVSMDFDAAQYSVREGSTVRLTLRLSAPAQRRVTLTPRVTAIGATVTATDYSVEPQEITFELNQTESSFGLTALADSDTEGPETLVISLNGELPKGVTAGRPGTATVTLVDESAVATGENNVLSTLRARITGGVVIVNASPRVLSTSTDGNAASQFSEASPYLAFEVQPKIGPAPASKEGREPHFFLEPFVNVRLTTIPVAGAGSTAADATQIQAPDISFLHSQKSAQIQLGAVVNFRNFGGRAALSASEKQYHWGLGFIVRTVYQSVTNSQRTRRVWNIDDDLYDAQTSGIRLTLREKSRMDRNWTPVAYIDASIGWFQNFEIVRGITDGAEYCLAHPAVCLEQRIVPPDDEFHSFRKSRLYVEGRLFIDPLYLGFDLNNGEGVDDLRFSAGVTFNLNALFQGAQ